MFRFIFVKYWRNIQPNPRILLLKEGISYLCAIFENTRT